MIYKYDKKTLNYKQVTGKWILITIAILLIMSAVMSLFTLRHINDVKFISEETRAIILREADKENEFSPEKLKAYILELNIKYPHIVLAQSQLETGGYRSKIFKENHNLFGMKVATQRPTTNKGEESGHAYYDSWRESVVDYAFYQAKYLSNLKSEAEYLQYLKQYYAEDPNYMPKLLDIISKQNRK